MCACIRKGSESKGEKTPLFGLLIFKESEREKMNNEKKRNRARGNLYNLNVIFVSGKLHTRHNRNVLQIPMYNNNIILQCPR